MSKKKQDAPPNDPVLATNEEIAMAQGEPGDLAAGNVAQPAKRHRRTPLELFRDQKKEHADAVEAAKKGVIEANLKHQEAIEAEKAFLQAAREALGL